MQNGKAITKGWDMMESEGKGRFCTKFLIGGKSLKDLF